MQQTEQPSAIKTLLSAVSEYLKLLIEDTKLNCVEKLTRLLSVATLFILLTIVTTVVMVFVSIGVSSALLRTHFADCKSNSSFPQLHHPQSADR